MKPHALALLLCMLFACNTQKHRNIESFWQDFQQAVIANDKTAVADMTILPLAGSDTFAEGLDEAGMTEAQFLSFFDRIFDATAKKTIAQTTADDLQAFFSPKDAALEALQLPVNTKIYSFMVSYIFDEGLETQTESATIFYLVEHEGVFKLAYLTTAG